MGELTDPSGGRIITPELRREIIAGWITTFQAASDEELVALYNREVGNTGWVSIRGHYLKALNDEMHRRTFDLSAISIEGGLSLASRVKIVDGRLVPFGERHRGSVLFVERAQTADADCT